MNSDQAGFVILFLVAIIAFIMYLARPKPQVVEEVEPATLEEDVWLDAFYASYDAICIDGRHPGAMLTAAIDADEAVRLFNKRFRDAD